MEFLIDWKRWPFSRFPVLLRKSICLCFRDAVARKIQENPPFRLLEKSLADLVRIVFVAFQPSLVDTVDYLIHLDLAIFRNPGISVNVDRKGDILAVFVAIARDQQKVRDIIAASEAVWLHMFYGGNRPDQEPPEDFVLIPYRILDDECTFAAS